MSRAMDVSPLLAAVQNDWPPSPHDPLERELALVADGWEVRLFTGNTFQYLVSRGFWHVQLWSPTARVSVLTPSRLTSETYEVFPIAGWKAYAGNYDDLAALVGRATRVPFVGRAELERIERCLVDAVVRSAVHPPSVHEAS